MLHKYVGKTFKLSVDLMESSFPQKMLGSFELDIGLNFNSTLTPTQQFFQLWNLLFLELQILQNKYLVILLIVVFKDY